MPQPRKTITLSDGTTLTIRRLSRGDHWALFVDPKIRPGALPGVTNEDRDRAYREFILAVIERAVSPRVEVRDLPPPEPNGKLYLFDFTDEDFDLLQNEIETFALGGAQQNPQFREADGRSAP